MTCGNRCQQLHTCFLLHVYLSNCYFWEGLNVFISLLVFLLLAVTFLFESILYSILAHHQQIHMNAIPVQEMLADYDCIV